ncbi:MAG: FtsW/RodA/SpoVE family cell cycle protein [Campylobacterales bacterium]|nr:FtsW/RodA/SpoVE family cell cycle protein [Campylobacterales bacterium]
MVDKYLFFAVSLLITIGVISSYSLSTFSVLSLNYEWYHFFIRQLFAGILAICIIWILAIQNPDKMIKKVGFMLLTFGLLGMIIMPFLPESFATSAGGAKRWIRLGPLSIAPVEFFKIGFIFFLAFSFSRKFSLNKKITMLEEVKLILPYAFVFFIVILLIAVMQNDLGQIVLIALTLTIMLFSAGSSIKLFGSLIISAIFAALIIIITSEHRILRVKSWWGSIQNFVLSLFPEAVAVHLRIQDAPEPYQISHSLNAIYNGGIIGTGVGNGIFKLGFLSEVHTDFVLAGIAEETGIIGLLFVTVTMFFIIFRIFQIANRSQNQVYFLFCLGVALLISFSFLINSFGISGLTPVKGIAVPFLSYGGSSLWALAFGIGMVLSISKTMIKNGKN